jgi:hypothetical protein
MYHILFSQDGLQEKAREFANCTKKTKKENNDVHLRLGLGVDEVEVLGVLRAFLFLGALNPASEDGDGVPSSTSLLFTC